MSKTYYNAVISSSFLAKTIPKQQIQETLAEAATTGSLSIFVSTRVFVVIVNSTLQRTSTSSTIALIFASFSCQR